MNPLSQYSGNSLPSLPPGPGGLGAPRSLGGSQPDELKNDAQQLTAAPDGQPDELREAFTDFIGQTLFGGMLASMRETVGKPAYMHGGRTEEIFQQQLDQYIVEDMTKASADTIADPMFELFNLQRR